MAMFPLKEQDRRDELVVKNLSQGMTQQEAVRAAGYSESTAACRATVITERALKKSPMIAALEEEGVTTSRLAKVVKKGLKARKPTMTTKDGTVIEGGADHAVRHKFLETAVRLRGEDPVKQTTQETETFEQRIRRLRGIAPRELT